MLNMKLLIFSLVLINFSASIFGRICSKNVQQRVSRTVLRNSARITTYRNWFGYINTQLTPYTYTDIEYSIITRLVYDCCIGYAHVGTLCKPICPTVCAANSYCYQPNICRCIDGYVWSYNGEVQPICKPKCKNDCPKYSNCTAPDTCSCSPGYDFSIDKNECLPICKQICPENGYCEKPNECKCNEGYETTVSNDNMTICRPSCEPACALHSVCFKPNYCICESGYKLSVDENKCEPVCSVGCPAYSVCIGAEKCECEPGYKMNENATQCNPICTAPCPEHGVCYKPNECLCDEGYRLKQFPDLNRTLECEVLCPDNCLPYGKCDPSNGCECYPGYDLRMDLINTKEPLCQPRCSQSCENGFCFSPDVCVCHPGYLMGPNSVCRAACSMGCINGDCIEPEICACNEGHSLKAGSVNECEPICEPECSHGDCVAPNICLCWQDYQPNDNFYDTNTCRPICEPNCENANCTSPNKCSCLNGFKPSLRKLNKCVGIDKNEEITFFSLDTTTDEGSSSMEYSTSLKTVDVEFSEDLPGIECSPYCKCWQIVGKSIPLGAIKCANICVDGADKPCLTLEACVCNLHFITLNCTLEEESFGNEGNSAIEYFCAEPFQTSKNTTNEKHTTAPISPSKFPWLITSGCVLVAILVVVVVSVVWTLNRRKPGGQYSVQFEPQ